MRVQTDVSDGQVRGDDIAACHHKPLRTVVAQISARRGSPRRRDGLDRSRKTNSAVAPCSVCTNNYGTPYFI